MSSANDSATTTTTTTTTTTANSPIPKPKNISVPSQIWQGLKIAFKVSVPHIRNKYIILPLSLMCMIVPLYGLNKLFKTVAHVNIPPSVTGMLILFFVMIFYEVVFGTKKANKLLSYINVPCGWSLRWINIFFTPSFTLLPLAAWVSVAEAFEIAGIFIVGFFVMFVGSIYFVYALQRLTGFVRKAHHDRDMPREDDAISVDEGIRLERLASQANDSGSEVQREELQRELSEIVSHSYSRTSHINVSHSSAVPPAPTPNPPEPVRMPDHTVVSFRRDCMGRISGEVSNDLDIVKSNVSSVLNHPKTHNVQASRPPERRSGSSLRPVSSTSLDSQFTHHVTTTSIRTDIEESSSPRPSPERPGTPDTTTETETTEITDLSARIASMVVIFFDWAVFLTLMLIGQIIYFTTGYSMPLHLGTIAICYRTCVLIPANIKKVAHPIIVSGALSMFFISVFALIVGQHPLEAFKAYKTGRNYLTFFDHAQKGVHPGAGDVLSTLLDCSIVSLAVPMFQYRAELRSFFWILSIPSVVFGLISFFAFPPISYYCGVAPERALAFISRSVTLGLALPITQDVQGSTQMVSVIAVLSGITGVVIAYPLYNKPGLRVREDDYVTRGISMGINASAIGTAHLLTIDPRASALSSLTFFLYGIILVIFSVIPPLVTLIRSWVDLGPVST